MTLFRFRKYTLKSIFLFLIAVIAAEFFISCKKKRPADLPGSEVEIQSEIESEEVSDSGKNFYSPAEDDASWVDSLLVKLEEERIADELARMEESRLEYQMNEGEKFEELEAVAEADENAEAEEGEAAEPEEKNPIELFFEEQTQGLVLSGKNNQLRFYEFQNEVLSPQKTEEGFEIVHAADGNVMRNFYNQSYQLVKKEEWKIKSASDAKKERTELFSYSEETGKVIQKEILTEKNLEKVSYNAAAFPSSTKKYAVDEDRQFIVMERSWKYDEENRVLFDEQKDYSYKDSDYKNKATVFTRKYEYLYNDQFNKKENDKNDKSGKNDKNEIPPDMKYYENGILKMQNKYTAQKGSYICWVYFDENLSVKTYYEEEIRIKDEYYNSGRIVRTKLYEQHEKQNEEQGEKQ